MGTITNISEIINKLTGGNSGNPQHPSFWFDTRIGDVAAPTAVNTAFNSMWKWNKTNGASAGSHFSSELLDRSTLGALPFSPATGGRELRLLGIETMSTYGAVFIMYDRLFQSVPLSGADTSVQGILGPNVTRNISGVGNEIWIEITNQIGATQTTVKVSYYNTEGILKDSPLVVIGGTGLREETRLIKVPLAQGDRGVKSIYSSQLTASTGVMGGYSILITKSITMIQVDGAGGAGFRDFITGIPVLPSIDNNACLTFACMPGTSAALIKGEVRLHMIEA